jgi:septal ring-binding cell division protein DamX
MPPKPEATEPVFETPARGERLQLLLHLMRNGGPAVYLRGPDGAGKTRFAQRLTEALEGEIESVRLDATMQADIAAALTALSANPGASLAEVMQELAARPLLLLIDNADELDSTTAGVLASWQDAGGRVLLVGRGKPEALNDLLELQYVDLPAFDEQESAAFLRLHAGELASRVTPDLAAAVHRAAGGLPGPLLQALNGMLTEARAADSGKRRPAKASATERRSGLGYWSAAALILGLVAAGLVYQDEINALFEPPAVQEVAAPATGPTLSPLESADESHTAGRKPGTPPPAVASMPRISLPELSPPPADGEQATPAAPAGGSAPGSGPAPDAPEPSAPVAESEPPATDDPLEAVMADAIAAAEKQPAGSADTAVAAEAVVTEQGETPEAPAEPALPEPSMAAAEPVAAPPVEVAAEEPAAAIPAPVEDRRPASPPPPAAAMREEATPPPRADAGPDPVDQGDAWLGSRESSHYTLQLVGARERASIEKFIREHAIAAPYAIFARDLGGRPWYSLVAGDYPDRAAAVAARARLPAGLRARDVWPRTFESIRKAE